jgi:GTP-binding protein
VVAYNKVDLPDSGDYAEEVAQQLAAEGVPAERVFAISAATGRGVPPLVRAVRLLLDALPEEVGVTAVVSSLC